VIGQPGVASHTGISYIFRCNASVSRASTLRDRSVYLGGELVQFLISLSWLSHKLQFILHINVA